GSRRTAAGLRLGDAARAHREGTALRGPGERQDPPPLRPGEGRHRDAGRVRTGRAGPVEPRLRLRPARHPARSVVSREVRWVAAALIETAPGRYLVQQRLPGKSRALLWEFPGGKVEPGETDAEALLREAREELGVRLEVDQERFAVRHAYEDLTVDLHLYDAR